MKNPIPHVALFATYTSTRQLEELARAYDNPGQALQMLYFTMNYCRHLVEMANTEAEGEARQEAWEAHNEALAAQQLTDRKED